MEKNGDEWLLASLELRRTIVESDCQETARRICWAQVTIGSRSAERQRLWDERSNKQLLLIQRKPAFHKFGEVVSCQRNNRVVKIVVG
jgi:hypothetical protein